VAKNTRKKLEKSITFKLFDGIQIYYIKLGRKSSTIKVWYTKNYDDLSEKSILEAVLNYGDWEDFLFLKKTLGLERIYNLFNEMRAQRRVNLRPQVVNYFSKYFAKYA